MDKEQFTTLQLLKYSFYLGTDDRGEGASQE